MEHLFIYLLIGATREARTRLTQSGFMSADIFALSDLCSAFLYQAQAEGYEAGFYED